MPTERQCLERAANDFALGLIDVDELEVQVDRILRGARPDPLHEVLKGMWTDAPGQVVYYRPENGVPQYK